MVIFRFLLIFLAVIFVSPVQADNNQDEIDCGNIGVPDKAVPACERLIESGVGDSSYKSMIFSNLCGARTNLGQFFEASKDCNKAKFLDLNNAQPISNLGVIKFYEGDYGLAIAYFSEAIEIDPNLAHAYFGRGMTYSQNALYHRAIDDFDKAILLSPNQANYYTSRGIAYGMWGEYEKAFVDLNRAIELNPRDDLAYGNRGLIYYSQAAYDKALSDFRAALKLNPNNAQALNGLKLLGVEQ